MEVRRERQLNPIGDEVMALAAVVGPILAGVLYALKAEVVKEAGGRSNVKLMMLSRLHRPGDGDVGICFEYAVHEALMIHDGRVVERIDDALKLCRIKAGDPRSILFGIEKSGTVQLIDTANNILNEESRALAGKAGKPPKLRPCLNQLAAAFRRSSERARLPISIRGLWKADLFLGSVDTQQWVGTSVKINPSQLEGAAGLRVGIIPARQGTNDKVRLDEAKQLVVCPLHHDGDFMQTFYEGMRIVQAFLASDGKLPKESLLPRPVDREICRMLEERRDFPVVEVIDALRVFGQPELLVTDAEKVSVENFRGDAETNMVLAPLSRSTI